MLSSLLQQFKILSLFRQIKEEVEQKLHPSVTGLPGVSKAMFVSALGDELQKPVIIICEEEEALKMYEDLLYFSPDSQKIILLDAEFGEIKLASQIRRRGPLFCVTTRETLAKEVISPQMYEELHRVVTPGETVSLDSLSGVLVTGGYERTPFVEKPGEFSIRGGILDVFVPGRENPWRLELNGDLIESIREFEPFTQRSLKQAGKIEILPFKLDAGAVPLWHYFPEGSVCIFDERSEPAPALFPERFLPLSLTLTRTPATHSFEFQPMEHFHGTVALLREKLSSWYQQGYQIFCFADNSGQQERLIELFEAHTAHFNMEVRILSGGFLSDSLKTVVITDEEMFGRYRKQKYLTHLKKEKAVEVGTFVDLKQNDYVVHEVHGIGIYEGLQHLTVGEKEEDFLSVRYAEGDRLYVPVEQMHLVQKYISPGRKPVQGRLKIYRLGGNTWQKLKQQVKESTLELAKDLLQLYSKREIVEGIRFTVDTHWQKEFEESFIYEETPDQLLAIAAVKKDLAQNKPMDRLICGDVGYGKTEVAMRAAFIAVENNKQAAVVVPTTLLAEQHLQTFRERFADYPVRIEMLSRFLTEKEQEKTIADLKNGAVDIIIGTHRLLQKDITVKNLGLLVIDEEQRFGVRHKERIKHLHPHVHVLTLSATPIPRTLEMSLSGLRDVSVINNPPEGRLSVKTYVLPYSEEVVCSAIQAELSRHGQVFFVHNRVRTIEKCANQLRSLLPGVKIKSAHGQMAERTLEHIMADFVAKKFEIIVATTIIEAGLDLPNVNTLIIDDATRFGLADLYQLRGRVGRSSKKAYCFFFFPQQYSFTEEAADRLKAIQEFSQLGAGFKIAMRDLEMRGAGNLLGKEQSGNVSKIGFDLYCKLLKETIEDLKGQKREVEVTATINLRLKAYIPTGYIADDLQRIEIYKRLAQAESDGPLQELKEEVRDRYGPLPLEVEHLFIVIGYRLIAQKLFIEEIRESEEEWQLFFHPQCPIKGEKFVQLSKMFGEQAVFIPGPPFTLRVKKGVRGDLKNILQILGE